MAHPVSVMVETFGTEKLERSRIAQLVDEHFDLRPGCFREELKLHRIEANIMPRNARSIRVVEKLGFINEGRSRKYLKIAGVWEDHLHFVLVNPDEEM